MTTGIPSTDLFNAMNETERAAEAGDYSLDLWNVADKARAAYYAAMADLRAKWVAIPYSDARSSAETNAEDTEGTAENELRWLYIALGTYQMNLDCGDYNADGSMR